MLRLILTGVAAFLCSSAAVNAQGNAVPDAVDDQFDVNRSGGFISSVNTLNTETLNTQRAPRASRLDDQRAVVVWHDESAQGADTSSGAVRARIYDFAAASNADDFVTNSTTDNNQWVPDVSTFPNGDFIVVWQDNSETGGDIQNGAIRGQRFGTNGQASGSEFLINATTANNQSGPRVATLANGGYAVAFQDESGGSYDISARFFDGSFNPVTADLRVNTNTDGSQIRPDIVRLGNGEVIVAWLDGRNVSVQRYSQTGVPVGNNFNAFTDVETAGVDFRLYPIGSDRFVIASQVLALYTFKVFEAGSSTPVSSFGLPGPVSFPGIENGNIIVLRSDGVNRMQTLDTNGHQLASTDVDFPITSNESEWSVLAAERLLRVWEDNADISARYVRYNPLFANATFPLAVLANDTDPDNDALTITQINSQAIEASVGNELSSPAASSITLPSGTVITLADGGVNYDPTLAAFALSLTDGATGADSFTYTISDGTLTDTANVTVTVTGVNDTPVADDDTLSVLQDDSVADMTALLLAGDNDPDTGETAQLVITSIDTPGLVGAATLNAGSVTYGPNGQFTQLAAGETAIDSFTYTITDPHGATSTATVTVTITGTNDAPVASDDALATTNTTGLDANLFADNGSGIDSDVDAGDSFTVSAVNGVPENVGTQVTLASGALLTANANGTVSYDPNGAFDLAPGATAQDSFTYTIADGSAATTSATATITVTGNSQPDAVDDDISVSQTEINPVNDDFGVNSTTIEIQLEPSVAALANGGFVVAWTDYSQTGADTSELAIRAQRFEASGDPVGAEFLVNSTTLSSQEAPTVAALANGGFVVAWTDNSQTGADTSRRAIRAQRFEASGDPVGAEFLVNSTTLSSQEAPTVAALANGGFVVAWKSDDQLDVRAQRFDASGDPTGSEFVVGLSDHTGEPPAVAALPSGGFLTVWTSAPVGIYARLFDASGDAIGSQFPVSTEFAHERPTLAALANGDFIVAWEDLTGAHEGDTGGSAILARRYDTSGDPVGAEFLVNSTTLGRQAAPTVAALANGGFVVAWTDNSHTGADTSESAIRAQRFEASGDPVGNEFLVNSTTMHRQAAPTVAALANGGFVVAWTDYSQTGADTSSVAIRARLFGPIPLAANDVHTLQVLSNDSDPDNEPLTITAVNGTSITAGGAHVWQPPIASPTAGPVTLPSGAVVSLGSDLHYDATAAAFAIALPVGAIGDDSFTYTISDGAATDTANVTVTLTGVNDAPTPDADTITVGEDDAATDVTTDLLDGDTDPDDGETALLTVSAIEATGTQGSAALDAGVVTYAPNGAFENLAVGQSASDVFSYTITDPGGLTATAAVTVTVNGANDAPTADADTLTFAEEEAARDVTATLLDGDSDPDDGETAQLTVTAVDTTLTLGRVTLNEGVLSYDPNGAFNALAQGQSVTDRFDYTISDPHGETASATATVTVNGFNGYPLVISTSGLGTGTVTSLPLGINCGAGGGCTALFTQNTEVALSALVGPGTTFEGWSGDCLDPSQPLCVVSMTQSRSVAARFSLTDVPDGRIVAATLPGARSGYVGGGDITVFMTVLSRQSTPAQACRVTAPNDPPFTLTYRQVNAQNEVIGDANPLFDLGNGGAINFVIALTPTRTTDQSGYVFLPRIQCENADLAPIEGVNSVLVSIGDAPVPDILSIGATPTADGVVRIPATGNRISFLSAAAVNIGAGDGSAGAGEATVTASVDTGAASLPVTLEVCESANTGGCITPRGVDTVTTVFESNVAKFFAVFVRANGESTIPFDPANARVFLRFADANGTIRSATSAAVSAPAPAGDQPALQSAMPVGRWSVLVRQGDGEWPSLVRASLFVLEDGAAILDDGQSVSQLSFEGFVAEGDIGRFATSTSTGAWSTEGSLQAGPVLSEVPGDLWGVRDARSDMEIVWSDLAGIYGDDIHITRDGSISGSFAGCLVTGEAMASGGTTTTLPVLTVSLMRCDASGEYTGIVDIPINDNDPALLISNNARGWRVESAPR